MTPPDPDPVPEVWRVRAGFIAMQFSDTLAQKRADAENIFTRAEKREYAWVGGTEASGRNGADTMTALKEACGRHGYRIYKRGGDCWLAIREAIMLSEPVLEWTKVIDGEAGVSTDKGLLCGTFQTPWGVQTVMVSHLLTNHVDPDGRKNERIVKVIGEHARLHGKGANLCAYMGDQNENDLRHDTFNGEPLTSAGDALNKWPGTGHGPIDVFAWYNFDQRVTWVDWKVFNDKRFPLFSDHFLCEGTVDIQALPA